MRLIVLSVVLLCVVQQTVRCQEWTNGPMSAHMPYIMTLKLAPAEQLPCWDKSLMEKRASFWDFVDYLSSIRNNGSVGSTGMTCMKNLTTAAINCHLPSSHHQQFTQVLPCVAGVHSLPPNFLLRPSIELMGCLSVSTLLPWCSTGRHFVSLWPARVHFFFFFSVWTMISSARVSPLT